MKNIYTWMMKFATSWRDLAILMFETKMTNGFGFPWKKET